MLPVTTQQAASMNASSSVSRGMILFDFASGLYGFWDGGGPFVWNGVTYNGGGQLFEIGEPSMSTGLSTSSISIRLYAMPGLEMSVLNTIFAEKYRGRPVTMMDARFDVDTRALIGAPIVKWRGIAKACSHIEDNDRAGIEMTVETNQIDVTKRGLQTANASHQALIDPDDLGFEHVSTMKRMQIPFGRALEKPAEATKRPPL